MNGALVQVQGSGYSASLINFGAVMDSFGGFIDCVGSSDPRQVVASNSPLPYFINPSGGPVYLHSNNVTIVNGNVGIGTSNPQYTLDVYDGNIGTLGPTSNINYYGGSEDALLPELVYKSGDILQVNYSELIPVLINAVKELSAGSHFGRECRIVDKV
jgi:hypothetical protein